ncbi:MAG: DUF4922 domain-containing protein [Salinivirgaceae bacterium]|jgi:ATP adenylyltransferase/5',5'''-P-1,P-4-tetraphosphate phosphorylase II|nr:DUF4922 domain-containing protein [Salinivirgaceae bacterium]
MNYQQKAYLLYIEQAKVWPLMAENLDGLKSVRLKPFQFEGFTLNVQFNPNRITSSTAKVDSKTIAERKCFLCKKNRPDVQTAVVFENKYEILCNPFPIFKEHYTISHKNHKPQEIESTFGDFLDLTKSLPDFTVLYNGPKCGASAPDHMHFQAGNRGYLPIEGELPFLKSEYGKVIYNKSLSQIYSINNSVRRIIVLESNDLSFLQHSFNSIYQHLPRENKMEEPLLNILAWYDKSWTVLLILREKHRPWQYFAEGEQNILLSPGAVDYGGLSITPLEKDFNKITKDDLADILNKTSLNEDSFKELCKTLVRKFKT